MKAQHFLAVLNGGILSLSLSFSLFLSICLSLSLLAGLLTHWRMTGQQEWLQYNWSWAGLYWTACLLLLLHMVPSFSHITTHTHTLPLSHCKKTRALPAEHDGPMARLWPTRYDVTLWCGGCVCARVGGSCVKGEKAVGGQWEPFVSVSKWIKLGRGLSIPGCWATRCCCCSDDGVLFSGWTAHSALLKNEWEEIKSS